MRGKILVTELLEGFKKEDLGLKLLLKLGSRTVNNPPFEKRQGQSHK